MAQYQGAYTLEELLMKIASKSPTLKAIANHVIPLVLAALHKRPLIALLPLISADQFRVHHKAILGQISLYMVQGKTPRKHGKLRRVAIEETHVVAPTVPLPPVLASERWAQDGFDGYQEGPDGDDADIEEGGGADDQEPQDHDSLKR